MKEELRPFTYNMEEFTIDLVKYWKSPYTGITYIRKQKSRWERIRSALIVILRRRCDAIFKLEDWLSQWDYSDLNDFDSWNWVEVKKPKHQIKVKERKPKR